jgi:hypothetical protein
MRLTAPPDVRAVTHREPYHPLESHDGVGLQWVILSVNRLDLQLLITFLDQVIEHCWFALRQRYRPLLLLLLLLHFGTHLIEVLNDLAGDLF